MALFFDIIGAANRYRRLARSQYWSADELHSYRMTMLDGALREAGKIPFYATRWNGAPRADDLAKLPTIRRGEIAELNRSALGLHPAGVRHTSDSSSGSTGMPAEFLFDVGHQRGRFAARMRYLRANGWMPFARTAWLIYAVFRTADNEDERLMQSRLRIASHFIHPTPGLNGAVDKLCDLNPTFLYTFPSYLEILLNQLGERGRTLPSLKKVFTGAEVLEDSLRQRTREQLGVDIAENYGSTEAFLGWECPAGNHHVNAEHVLLELVDEGNRPVGPGKIGRVLVTTLENRLAPLVRYDIGDYAAAAAGPCACGRTLPLLGKIIGRGMNLFRLGDGRLISPWHLATAVRQCPRIKQFQIVQKSIELCTIRYVADDAVAADAEDTVRADFRKVLGDVQVVFERTDEIPRTVGGKYITARSEVTG